MPRFAANLSTLFPEVPFLERFAAARSAGFRAVEFQFPYAYSLADLVARQRDTALDVILFNMPPGDFDKGERGIACLPGRQAEFRAGIDTAITYAKALNCKLINCLAGIPPHGLSPDIAQATLVENLDIAAGALAREHIQLVIEPLNTKDVPDFCINTSVAALAVMDKVKHSNLKLQYDLYHMQRMEGELTATLTRLLPRIGHIQIADAPLRHEPGTGEINFTHMLKHIDDLGYAGWIGCEYRPRTTTIEGLRWIAGHGYTL